MDTYRADKSVSVGAYKLLMRPFVYGWFRNGECLYIGATTKGFHRLMNNHHVLSWYRLLDTDVIDLWYCDEYSNLYKLEAELIAFYKPKYNKTWQRPVDSSQTPLGG